MKCALDGCELPVLPPQVLFSSKACQRAASALKDVGRERNGHKPRRPRTCIADGCDQPMAYRCWRYCSPAHYPPRVRPHVDNPFGGRRRLDDIDEVAVLRALQGGRVTLNRGERRAVVAELTRRGMSAGRIAEHNGSTKRTVVRDRAVLRAAA